MPDSHGSVDLGSLSSQEQEALAAMAEEHDTDPNETPAAPEALFAITAFTVVLAEGAQWMVVPAGTPLNVQRDPAGDDFVSAAAVITKDTFVAEAAQTTAFAMQQIARQQMEQMQTAGIADQLRQRGGLRG